MKLMGRNLSLPEDQTLAAADREIFTNKRLAGCCGNLVNYHGFNWTTLLTPTSGALVPRPVLLFDYVSGGNLRQYVNAVPGY